MIAWVLHYDYGPLEGPGKVMRVYLDKDRAEQDLALVDTDQSGVIWHLSEVPVMGTTEKESD
jgi:hypothetical protein